MKRSEMLKLIESLVDSGRDMPVSVRAENLLCHVEEHMDPKIRTSEDMKDKPELFLAYCEERFGVWGWEDETK